MTDLMVAARITDASRQRYAYQADPHCASIDDEIAQTCVAARHEQLCNLDGPSENQKEDREQSESTLVAQTESKSSSTINQEMLDIMGRGRFRTEGGRDY